MGKLAGACRVDFPVRPFGDELRQDPEQPWTGMAMRLPIPIYPHQLVTIPTVVQGEGPTGNHSVRHRAKVVWGDPDKLMVGVEDVYPSVLSGELLASSHRKAERNVPRR